MSAAQLIATLYALALLWFAIELWRAPLVPDDWTE